jgi:amino acid transporter
VTGATTILMLLLNIGNQKVFYTLVSIAIILFYVPYLCVTAPMLLRRLRGGWPNADHGPYYHLGRWGLPINVVAVVYGLFMIVNLAWPRTGVYGSGWYYQYGGIMYPALVVLLGGAYYVAKLKPAADVEAQTAGEPGATVQPT